MGLKLLILAFLIGSSLCQIVSKPNDTLSHIYRANIGTSAEEKAMQYLLLSYPELSNYSNVTITKIGRESNPFGLQDFYFTLFSGSARVSVIATLSQASPGAFISISPLVTSMGGSNNISTSDTRSRGDSNFYIISGDEIKVINAGNQTQRMVIPGGFQVFNNGNDSRLERAQALLASLHPHMVNYSPRQIKYQIVSGINFQIQYTGNDGITSVTALVMVNLVMEPYLMGFKVNCLVNNSSSMSSDCNDDAANQIFSACEALLLVHPELLAFQMISMVSDDSIPQDGILFIITYQNTQTNTRVMAQLNILGNVFSIMSYYTYLYPIND